MIRQGFLPLDPAEFGLSGPLSDDIQLLNELLGDVLREQEGAWILELARRLMKRSAHGDSARAVADDPDLANSDRAQRLLRAFTILFQLLNTAEQKEIVRVNRLRNPRPESLGEAIDRLAAEGLSAGAMQNLLDRIEICPTLTAHPTEARRRAVLNKLEGIAAGLTEATAGPAAPLDAPLDSAERGVREMRRQLTSLWQTDEMRANAILVSDEARNILYFVEHTILPVVPWLHEDLRRALGRAYPGHKFHVPPFLRYRSWVGGDRDGNPNVTSDVTWQTLLLHREIALGFYLERVAALRRDLTQSARKVPPSSALSESLEADGQAIPVPPDRLARYTYEPYALKLVYIYRRLQATLRHLEKLSDYRAEGPDFQAAPPAYACASAFVEDLRLIQQSLREGNAAAVADEGPVANLVVQAEAFGFQLATLDVRQHSDEHAKAIDALLQAAGALPASRTYSALDEAEKVRILTRELSNPRPLTPRGWQPPAAAGSAMEVFEVIRHARRYLGDEAVSAYVISMTHGISDVLEPLLLAREAGLARLAESDAEPASELDIVPLFETIDDLERCDGLMAKLFANPAYRRHLAARGRFQEIMLGYSDSSKDGGYLAANWALNDTQDRLAACCRRAGVTLRLFHGRGGTVGRGGGRANRAILSQPPGSFSGRIRFTEQGEVVSFRYSAAPIAHRHLEQIANAVLVAASRDLPPADGQAARAIRRRIDSSWAAAMRELAEISRAAYRRLVHEDPDFWRFYLQATPITHISRLPIASRPVFRPGKALISLDQIRAIPWVFAWVQCRYVLPGWYGIGEGLDRFANSRRGNLETLRRMYARWPFFRTVIDNAQLELVRADVTTAAHYAARVQPAALGERVHAAIVQDYEQARRWILAVTQQDDLLSEAQVVRSTVAFRNPAVAPMNALQLALMDRWDALDDHESTEAAGWRDAILSSIAGIAAAMQSTG